MKSGELRVRTQKCSLCEWTMPSQFEMQAEVEAAFIGHVTSNDYACIKANLVPIPGTENAPIGKVVDALQLIIDEYKLPLQVELSEPALVQLPDAKCGHC
jgi:hypothetical protein